MFGVPFILQVPREGMDHDKLYELIVTRMKRCLKSVTEQDQTTATEGENSTMPSLNSTDENEMDTDENNVSPDVENGNESHPMEANGLQPATDAAKPKRLFSMELVNLSGNTSLGRLKQNGKSITLAGEFNYVCHVFLIDFQFYFFFSQLKVSWRVSGNRLLRKLVTMSMQLKTLKKMRLHSKE